MYCNLVWNFSVRCFVFNLCHLLGNQSDCAHHASFKKFSYVCPVDRQPAAKLDLQFLRLLLGEGNHSVHNAFLLIFAHNSSAG